MHSLHTFLQVSWLCLRKLDDRSTMLGPKGSTTPFPDFINHPVQTVKRTRSTGVTGEVRTLKPDTSFRKVYKIYIKEALIKAMPGNTSILDTKGNFGLRNKASLTQMQLTLTTHMLSPIPRMHDKHIFVWQFKSVCE
ncbi:hypothetical protein BsWGS_02538 [Bradybaena similaris]